ncbi:hypothetical protein WICANDRAFT_61786, partial [Wickerhamomyces anomalus NRRL Y-366-8]
MRFINLFVSIFLWGLLQLQGVAGQSTASTVSGIATVSSNLVRQTTLSSACAYSSQTGAIDGKGYKATYDITGKTTGTFLRSRVLTITWFFQFDHPIDANAFAVTKLGLEISNIKGTVNVAEGSFIVSYDVTIPYLTFITSIPSYCLLDYVSFQFTVPQNKDNTETSYYAFYVGTAGAVVSTILSQAVCGVTTLGNCPVYTSGFNFDCSGLGSFLDCDDTATITNSYSAAPITVPSPYTTTYTNSDGKSLTGVVSYYTTTGPNGRPATGTTTSVRTVPSPVTTTYTNAAGQSVSGLVSYFPTTNSNGQFATGATTIPFTVPSPVTTTYTNAAGQSISGLVSYFPTTNSNGQFATGATTIPFTVPSPIATS